MGLKIYKNRRIYWSELTSSWFSTKRYQKAWSQSQCTRTAKILKRSFSCSNYSVSAILTTDIGGGGGGTGTVGTEQDAAAHLVGSPAGGARTTVLVARGTLGRLGGWGWYQFIQDATLPPLTLADLALILLFGVVVNPTLHMTLSVLLFGLSGPWAYLYVVVVGPLSSNEVLGLSMSFCWIGLEFGPPVKSTL